MGSDRFRRKSLRSGLTPYYSDDLQESGGAEDGRGVEAGGVLAIPVVAAAVEDDGRNAGPGDEIEEEHERVRLLPSGLTPSAIGLQMGSGYHLVA